MNRNYVKVVPRRRDQWGGIRTSAATRKVVTVNDATPPPEQWRSLFDKIGVEFGYRPLATRIGMDHTRLRRLLLGGGTTSTAIQSVADAFGVKPEKIRELREEQATAYEPFILPDRAGRLTSTERDVIRAMVRALLDARGGAQPESNSPDDSPDDSQGDGWGRGLNPGGDWGEDGDEGQDVG